ncbi:MAG: AzlD domain-containing protein [Gaiellales bacterium]|nr:AzlD domain-containing protein [Gaiellales bacterium]
MTLFLEIVAMAAVTYLTRCIPLLAMAGRHLPKLLLRFLAGVPVGVLAAFAVPLIFAPEGRLDVGVHNLNLLAAIPCLAVALWRRSLIWAVVAGAAAMALLRLLLG